ncbi:MAG: purine-nucleoside phosphorylase [Pseudomonadota bacterium]|nr:purine-nucleoside phosphorylase [Pseudomonadota bacterium]
MDTHIHQSADIILGKIPGFKPKIAVVLGSGLGAVANLLDEKARIPYTDLPGFPLPAVEGHEGSLRLGYVDGVPALFLKGRVHLYEGGGFEPLKIMIRTLKTAGIETLFLTNAAGSLRKEYGPGSLVAVADHLNLTGTSPLVGRNDDQWGPRFPGMENAWCRDARAFVLETAAKQNIPMGEGVFGGLLGPCFETLAEIRMLKTLGADTVGMSMVAENIVAVHCGLPCVGVSAITNLAAGMSDVPLSHEQTLQGAKLAEQNMARLVRGFITGWTARQQQKAA